MPELLSVILPVLRTESEIEGCINNLLGQTCESMELILVGNAKPDKLPEDPRIISMQGDYSCVYDAVLAGLAVSKGSLIAVADPRNRLNADMYGKMAAAMEEKKADIAIARNKEEQSVSFSEEQQGANEEEKPEIIVPRWDKVFGPRKASFELLLGLSVDGVLWDKLFRRALFEELPTVPETVFFKEEALLLALLRKACSIVHLREPLYERNADGGNDGRFEKQMRKTQRLQERILAAEKYWPEFSGRIMPAYREELEQLVLVALGTDWSDAQRSESVLTGTLWPFFAAHEAEAETGASWQKRTKYRILLEKPRVFWSLWPMIRRVKSFLIHD